MIPQSDRPIEARFANPAAENRILKIIHGWPDDPAAQDAQIRALASQGFGGVVCNVSFSEYLESEEKWDAFLRAVDEAKKVGMALWLYDEKGYPSGAAGGIVLRDHPEWEARGLLVADARSDGEAFSIDLPPGELYLAAAYPVGDDGIDLSRAVDLSGQIDNGKLAWVAPEGEWHVFAITEDSLYEGTHAAHSLADKLAYVNLLMPEPTEKFIDVTHAEYVKRMGDDLGEHFVATFTDEPSLMNVFMSPMPYKPLPWAPNLPVEFAKRRGYDLKPNVPALITEAGPDGAKIRHDFWLTVGELVSENYFGQIESYCAEHNVPSGGHLLWEEDIRNHVAFYGDFFRCLREMGAPSIDCLTSVPATVPWQIARLIGSAADLDGKPVTMSETSDFQQNYRADGDTRPVQVITDADVRGTCNRLMLGGITTITSYYTWLGIDTTQLRRLNEYVGRVSTMITGGHQVTDIAVVYPVETMWTRFEPARHNATDSPGADEVRQIFDAVSTGLYAARRDFTYLDSRTLAEASVENGALTHGDMRWRVVVLPCVDTLPDAAWLNLAEFQRSGGVVVAAGARPVNSAREFPSPRIEQLGESMFGVGDEPLVVRNDGGAGIYLPGSAVGLLPTVLDGVLESDAAVGESRSPVRVTHRLVDGRHVYYLINDSGVPATETVSLATSGGGQQWDLATGEVTDIASGQGVSLTLEPYGGAILTFAEARAPKLTLPDAGSLPGMVIGSLPEVQPVEGHGEFVDGGIASDDDLSTAERPVWQVTGTLTKTDVDTHQFSGFEFPAAIDLTGAESIVIDTWVPGGQTASAQVLIILHEQGGGMYFGTVGRSLAAPGHAETYMPISKLDLAGWAEDANGRLDLDQIVRISVGWGGYFGTEGETVAFSLAAPRVARRDR